jgi:amino acid adenylation domain-containing protein
MVEGRRETVPELFQAQVRRGPKATALADEIVTLSYAELNARANALAHYLISLGAGPERLVAVLMPRTAGLVTVLLAVLKAGAAYVPLDPDYPAERLAFMIEDSRPLLIVTDDDDTRGAASGDVTQVMASDARLRELLAQFPATDPGISGPDGPPRAGNAAYVIYTSGSTGRPKGVVVEHGALSTYLAYACAAYPAVADSALLHSPVSFDLTVTALWAPLLCGGRVQVAAQDGTAPAAPPAFLKVTPSHLSVPGALPPGAYPSGDLVIGGEALAGEAVAQWRQRHPAAAVINEYGPTEATVGCCAYRVAPGDALPPGPVPIGTPTPGARLYLLDGELRPVPAGEPGELYIAGPQLARGYLNRPALTAGRFVACPFGPPGARMYRTGDLARQDSAGDLVFLGRADDQVKINGYRVEPGEIESVLARHPDVAQAAVTARQYGGATRLVAYLVARPGHHLETTQVRKHAAAALPGYLMPALLLTTVAHLPLTPNGKLDRAALPDPGTARRALHREPATPGERRLCTLFAELLAQPDISADDDFFEVGGTSVAAIRLAAALRKSDTPVTLADILEYRTPALIAAALTRTPAAEQP